MKILRQWILILPLLFTAYSSKAAFIIGGEMYYECLGFKDNDPTSGEMTYRIYMVLYRDCNSTFFDSDPAAGINASVSVYRGSEQIPFGISQFLAAPVKMEVGLDPGNACVEIPEGNCVEQGRYEFEIDLPVSTDPYHIVYQRCCRDAQVSNIESPERTGATFSVEISPEAQVACNNSPVFREVPPFILCQGERFVFPAGATDADGNTLAYEFCAPFVGGGIEENTTRNGLFPDPDAPPPFTPVTFIAPYSAQEPIGAGADFSINTQTGEISGLPEVIGQYVVGVCVSEFDAAGNKIGEVRRDLKFVVANCEPNVNAQIESDEIDEDGTFVLSSCGGTSFDFINSSFDEALIESYSWEFDDVNGTPVNSTERNPTIDFGQAGTYNGRMIVEATTGCVDTAFISVSILSNLNANFSIAGDSCSTAPYTFTNTTTADDLSTLTYRWDFSDGQTSTQASPSVSFTNPDEKIISLYVTDDNNCVDSVSKLIHYFPLQPITNVLPTATQECIPVSFAFTAEAGDLTDDYSVIWDFGDGTESRTLQATHTYEQAGSYDIGLTISAPNGCEESIALPDHLQLSEGPTANFSFSPEEPNSLNSTVSFTDLSVDAEQLNWDFGGLGNSDALSPSFTFPNQGSYRVLLTAFHANGCIDTLSQTISITPLVDVYIPNAFSPNGDGVNDIFRVFGPAGGGQNFEMSVFSRWGDRIFYSTNPEVGWDGSENNQAEDAPQGVYVYFVTFTGPDGTVIEEKGFVTLVR